MCGHRCGEEYPIGGGRFLRCDRRCCLPLGHGAVSGAASSAEEVDTGHLCCGHVCPVGSLVARNAQFGRQYAATAESPQFCFIMHTSMDEAHAVARTEEELTRPAAVRALLPDRAPGAALGIVNRGRSSTPSASVASTASPASVPDVDGGWAGTFYEGDEPAEAPAEGQTDFATCVLVPAGEVILLLLPLWATMADLHEVLWVYVEHPAATVVELRCRGDGRLLPDAPVRLGAFDLPRFLSLELRLRAVDPATDVVPPVGSFL